MFLYAQVSVQEVKGKSVMAGVQAMYMGQNGISKAYDVNVKGTDGSHIVRGFKTEKEAKDFANTVNAKFERTPDADTFGAPKKSKAKQAGKAVASAFCPGLGQAIDGRWKDGLKHYAAAAGYAIGGALAGLAGYKSFVKAVQAGGKTPVGFYAGMAVATLAAIGLISTRVHSAVDAYKGGNK